MNAALIAVSKFEVMGLQVRSDETTAAAATSFKRRRQAVLASELSNDHTGGRQSVLKASEGIVVDLGAVIEDVASRLGKHHYSSNGDGTSALTVATAAALGPDATASKFIGNARGKRSQMRYVQLILAPLYTKFVARPMFLSKRD